ncbi:MAG: aromatic ring-hydroxylating dioxygenase subunit alpha [Gammaproteobacteria bacterium]|nr:aromatic ring-hydroxylating dioxygenase subunit alpha [Gammaproteobacteria bacterium]
MDIRDLVIDDRKRGIFRVHRSSMTSADLFHRERELIFDRCWIYLGHESEVERPGDYRRRTVAGRPLFFVRGKDGQVRVFLNSCPHRGAVICRRDAGNARVLRCFYHAWSFNTEGELIGVPDRNAYGPNFDPTEHGLKEPPRVDSYRGFFFVSFNPHAEDLSTYLAEARDYLDLVVDQAEKGMRVISGSNKYAIKANWKLLAENSLDGYHLIPTHRTYVDYVAGLGTDDSGDTLAARPPGAGRALGHGHCVSENISRNGRPIARWHPVFGEEARKRIARTRRRLVRKYGEQRAYRMADTSRNLLIYPNLLIMDFVAISIRYIEPVAPDRMEVTAWHLVPREESGAVLATRLDSYLTFLGPGGFATPDDVEALESCQTGFRASGNEWSDISRGMMKSRPGTSDELQMRGFWRQWHANMQGRNTTNVQDGQPGESQASAAASEADDRGHRASAR